MFYPVNQPTLVISVSCQVSIRPLSESRDRISSGTVVQTEGDVELSQSSGTITIRQKGGASSGGGVFIGDVSIGGVSQSVISTGRGNVVIGGGGRNISIVNGRVFINGKEVTEGNSETEPYVEPVVTIYTQSCKVVDANLSGGALHASVPVDSASIKSSGGSEVRLSDVVNLEVKTSGSTEVEARMSGGGLRLRSSGSSEFNISGEIGSADIDCSGSTAIRFRR